MCVCVSCSWTGLWSVGFWSVWWSHHLHPFAIRLYVRICNNLVLQWNSMCILSSLQKLGVWICVCVCGWVSSQGIRATIFSTSVLFYIGEPKRVWRWRVVQMNAVVKADLMNWAEDKWKQGGDEGSKGGEWSWRGVGWSVCGVGWGWVHSSFTDTEGQYLLTMPDMHKHPHVKHTRPPQPSR